MRPAKESTNCLDLKESDIQIQVADWLRLYESARDFLFFSVPGEAMGAAKTGAGLGRMARLKRMGLRAGVADIVIVKAGKVYFLELKREAGKQSKGQIDFMHDCERLEIPYYVARSFEEAQWIIQYWKIIE
jgi:hypothetical protein